MPAIQLLALLLMASNCLLAAATYKDHDAIHPDDLLRYNAYMDMVQGRHAINIYLEGQVIKVNLYEGDTDTFEKSASFRASGLAPTYFAEREERLRQVLGSAYDSPHGHDPQTLNQKRDCGPKISKRATDSDGNLDSEARQSRCGQFCSNGAHCSEDACPRCRYTGGRCYWQKSCE